METLLLSEVWRWSLPVSIGSEAEVVELVAVHLRVYHTALRLEPGAPRAGRTPSRLRSLLLWIRAGCGGPFKPKSKCEGGMMPA
jgi:hypothetical protein